MVADVLIRPIAATRCCTTGFFLLLHACINAETAGTEIVIDCTDDLTFAECGALIDIQLARTGMWIDTVIVQWSAQLGARAAERSELGHIGAIAEEKGLNAFSDCQQGLPARSVRLHRTVCNLLVFEGKSGEVDVMRAAERALGAAGIPFRYDVAGSTYLRVPKPYRDRAVAIVMRDPLLEPYLYRE